MYRSLFTYGQRIDDEFIMTTTRLSLRVPAATSQTVTIPQAVPSYKLERAVRSSDTVGSGSEHVSANVQEV
ncbi:hypothetical protein AURDEDRAFT_173417 [Auricularia subglabra TFB-10046 SS5]|uniref:Uncharacterized protein n=1 Tax=Auricularia subglabra (strain TFB-10046 / SS5) TaxID=717982 RepID=J0WW00_AURST|nr:hypothetical protein AURDEDRAFT_173417 [Auricularia subglabra TFB-10046 SS5]